MGNGTGLGNALAEAGGSGQSSQGISIQTFLASLATAVVVFAVEFLLFLAFKGKLTRIYQPRTYLVPDRERTKPSPPGLFAWIGPVFRTSSSEFIQKCGLDAYFFLRYLRMLLKIFIPLGLVILPILLPVNRIDGKNTSPVNGTANSPRWNVTGLDQLAWGNVDPRNTDRYWAHLILALLVIIYVCGVFYDELRGYIRLRQAFLTSPQHRLRASATTVLVTSIPRKWLSVEALDNLFDVFPGGIRNIWINRNFDELNEKVKLRNQLALTLESAETELIKNCKRAQLKAAKAAAKKAGKTSKEAQAEEERAAEARGNQMAMTAGVSSGDPHEVAHTVDEALAQGTPSRRSSTSDTKRRNVAIGAVEAVGQGVGKFGKTVFGGLKKVEGGLDKGLTRNPGFVADHHDAVVGRAGDAVGDGVGPGYQFARSSNDDDLGYPHQSALPAEAAAPGPTAEPHPRRSEVKRPFWKSRGSSNSRKSARSADPHDDEHPLTDPGSPTAEREAGVASHGEEKSNRGREGDEREGEEYPIAYNEEFDNEDYGEPLWKKYIKPKDRETMRLPIFGLSWMPSLPLIGKKVDTIDHCRRELARLNLEIEIDQQQPEKFPLMNSAFIQFNHQVAAHMACQAVSHHVPKQMAPRIVEISPDDVLWDNMSIKWWERYIRTFGVIALVSAMVVGWAFPVAFTGLLSQLTYLESAFPWLRWLSTLPGWLISAIQGILPPLFLAILMALLPIILRFLCMAQGVSTGMAIELTVQNYYFAFLFVQLFLVVSISSSVSTIITDFTHVTSWPTLLATNIPRSSNYFFSYMILQAMSVSAGALLQIISLISWFILAPLLDNTARKKWARTTNLNMMQWGTFFPVYTTLASIGLVYCVIAPLILIFNVITFSLFWIVYRYNTLYVTKFRFDTGGLLFPKAINQLFTGIYVMELSLIGLFFLVRDAQNVAACTPQAIIMIVAIFLTAGFQWLLNDAFAPLIRYLPITLEDDAVRRDEEFARAQRARLGLPVDDDNEEQDTLEHQLDERARQEREENRNAEDIEMKELEARRHRKNGVHRTLNHLVPELPGVRRKSWADRSPNRRSKFFAANSDTSLPSVRRMREKLAHDAEAQAPVTNAIGQALFAGIHDELEDLTPDERDRLVQRAFLHEALRAKRPVVWIPRDDLGVSDDEIYRTQRFSKHIWISNEYQALDGKCRTIFRRSPPDFSEVDLIQL